MAQNKITRADILATEATEDGQALVSDTSTPTGLRFETVGSTIAIGDPVVDGAIDGVLFVDDVGQLRQDTGFIYDPFLQELNIGGGNISTGSGQTPLNVTGDLNNYIGISLQNLSTGDSASGDLSISADNDGTDLIGHYTDLYQLNSGYTGTAVGNLSIVTIHTAGSAYIVGDILTLISGDGNGQVEVLSVDGGGGVTSVSIYDSGTGYTITTNISTTGGTGTGAKFNVISLIDNTALLAGDGGLYVSGGNLVLSTDDSVAGKVIKFTTGGFGTSHVRMEIHDDEITTTVPFTEPEIIDPAITGDISSTGARVSTGYFTDVNIASTGALTCVTSGSKNVSITQGTISFNDSSGPAKINLVGATMASEDSNKTVTIPNTTGTVGTVVTKTDTGDGTGIEGIFQINTFDNTFKVYADGAWRTLSSW